MFPDNLAALNAEQLNARHHMHPQFAQLPELAPYPMTTGVLGMSFFLVNLRVFVDVSHSSSWVQRRSDQKDGYNEIKTQSLCKRSQEGRWQVRVRVGDGHLRL